MSIRCVICLRKKSSYLDYIDGEWTWNCEDCHNKYYVELKEYCLHDWERAIYDSGHNDYIYTKCLKCGEKKYIRNNEVLL